MYKNMLYEAFVNHENYKFLEIFEEYLSQRYGVDYDIIFYYVNVLINTRQYDKAYKNIKLIEKYMMQHNLERFLIKFYILCAKPKDLERVIKECGVERGNEIALIKAYLLQGKIEEAKDYISIVKYRVLPRETREKIYRYERLIYNHQVKDGFIETVYDCFVENGNKLEPGHIVHLKHEPVLDFRSMRDEKKQIRPYMVWKIDGDKVYLFPVSTAITERRIGETYILYKQKYPNSQCDRFIKDNSCYTTIDNILTVKDKVLPEDYSIILRSIFYATYFSDNNGNIEARQVNKEFLEYYMKVPGQYDVMKITDRGTHNHRYYLVLNCLDRYYEVVEVDDTSSRIINSKVEKISKTRLIYNVYELDMDNVTKLLEELSYIRETENRELVGKKVVVKGKTLIVISASDNECVCVNEYYQYACIEKSTISKDDIEMVVGEIPNEEVKNIKEILKTLKRMIKVRKGRIKH